MREILIAANDTIAAIVRRLATLERADPETQERAAGELFEQLVRFGVLNYDQAGCAELQDIGAPTLVISWGDSLEWLEVDATTGRVYCVTDQGLD